MDKKYSVDTLGKCSIQSPLIMLRKNDHTVYHFVKDEERVLHDVTLKNHNQCKESGTEPVSFEKAGPREFIYFDPSKTKVAIVTCGGLCPGLNNVIRSIVRELYYRYNVTRITGIKYGFEGFIPKYDHPVVDLTPDVVEDIYMYGGTILGSSRGNHDVSEIVDALERMNINILFCLGGDGTLRGANEIKLEIDKRNLKIAVAGIP
jgi:6-phosphofructokinase 1